MNEAAPTRAKPCRRFLNRREAKKGFGDKVPKWVWAIAQPYPAPSKEVVSEQNAKHSAIETGLCGKARFERFNIVNRREAEKGV